MDEGIDGIYDGDGAQFHRLKNMTNLELNQVVDRWETGRCWDDLDQEFPTGVHFDPRGSTGLLEGPRLVTLIAYC